jgi:hypothetical protein
MYGKACKGEKESVREFFAFTETKEQNDGWAEDRAEEPPSASNNHDRRRRQAARYWPQPSVRSRAPWREVIKIGTRLLVPTKALDRLLGEIPNS